MVFQATKIRAFEKLLLCFDEEKEVLSCNVKGVHLYLLFLMLNCAHCYHLQPSNWLTIHTVRVISPLVALACSWQCSLYLYVKISILKKHTFVRVDVASYFVNLQQPTNNLAYTSEGEQRVNIKHCLMRCVDNQKKKNAAGASGANFSNTWKPTWHHRFAILCTHYAICHTFLQNLQCDLITEQCDYWL